jgi:formimidoylglutamate deiminase
MHKLYARTILVNSHWEHDLTLTIRSDGILTAIEKGKDKKARSLKGPVIPGMLNVHSHAFQRGLAGFSEYKNDPHDTFWGWRKNMYRFIQKITPDDLHHIALWLYIEMLKSGYTSVGEFHYLHHQFNGVPYTDPAEMSHQVIEAAEMAGIALTHLPVFYHYSGLGEKKHLQEQSRFIHSIDSYIQLLQILEKQYSKKPLFRLGMAPHSLRAVSALQLKKLIAFKEQCSKKIPFHIHISEQNKEVDDVLSFYGARPVEWLFEHFNVDNDWCFIHATHLNAKEIQKLSQSQAIVGLCPLTEANLGDGIFPIQAFSNQGGAFAIGSDSHASVNVSEELRLLEYTQRLLQKKRTILVHPQKNPDPQISSSLSPHSVAHYLYTHTVQSGAQALDQNAKNIAIGQRADWLVLDPNDSHLFSKKNDFILDASLFSCHQLPVKDVLIAGKWVIENKKHPLEEKAKINYKKTLKRLME